MVDNKIIRILMFPADTARSISNRKLDLITPFFIVLVTGFLLGVVGTLKSHKPFEAEAFQTLYSSFFMISGWISLSVFVFLISHPWRKIKVSYLKTMELIGYAYLPFELGLVIEIISLNLGITLWIVYSTLFGSWSILIMIFVVREINKFSTIKSIVIIFTSYLMFMVFYWFLTVASFLPIPL